MLGVCWADIQYQLSINMRHVGDVSEVVNVFFFSLSSSVQCIMTALFFQNMNPSTEKIGYTKKIIMESSHKMRITFHCLAFNIFKCKSAFCVNGLLKSAA